MSSRSKKLEMKAKFILVCMVLLGGAFAAICSFAEPGNSTGQTDSLSATVSLTGDDNEIASALAKKTPRIPSKRPLKSVAQNNLLSAGGKLGDRINNIKSAMRKPVKKTGTLGSSITNAQRENLYALTADNKDARVVQVGFNKVNGTVTFMKIKEFVRGPVPGVRSLGVAQDIADQFISKNRNLLGLKNSEKELTLKRKLTDELGATHYRYQQVFDGVPLFGRELIVHTDASNSVYLLNGYYEKTEEWRQTTPEITESQALGVALEHLGMSRENIACNSTEVVFYTKSNGKLVLTYKMDISIGISERWFYFIDAISGVFAHRIDGIHAEAVSASGTDLNSTARSFNAWNQNGIYYLVDPTTPSSAVPADPISSVQSPGNTYVLTAQNSDGSSLDHITSTSLDSDWDATGVSTMCHIKTTYDYYKNTLNHNGIDGNNMNFMAVVHLGNNYAGAFWNGKCIVFGDGDNTTFSNLAGALDITAHEIQHGVTQFSAGLIYENQSGALNEGYSDLFACMIDEDWVVGEDCTIAPPGYLRSLADPSQGLESLPTKMSEYRNLPIDEDHGGVHVNMSIPSRAGYLMAEGLDADGLGTSIGRTKTAKIWYRALTTYLTPFSQFLDARRCTIQAAEDLYGSGSTEVAAVQAAWDTVEVTAGSSGTPDNQEPTPGDEVTGDDVMVYLYPMDGTHDNPFDPNEHYDLYVQIDVDGGYAEANDKGPLNDNSLDTNRPLYTRPAAYTNSKGDTIVFYSTEDYDLHYVWFYSDGRIGESRELLDTKDIYSLAISPDGRYFAYTTPSDNKIYILDMVDDRSGSFAVVPPTDTDSPTEIFNTIMYADALAFDYTGKTLVFDALNCLSTPDSSCSDGKGHQYWSIGFLTLAEDPDDATKTKGTFEFLFPTQDPDYDIGFPAFASNNSYVVAVDIIDNSSEETQSSMVWTLNWKDQQRAKVANPNLGANNLSVWGVPGFWGGDNAITIQGLANDNRSAYRVPIDSNWAGPADSGFAGGDTITQVNNYAVAMPIMHRRAARSVSSVITYSASSIAFSDVPVGSSSTQNLTLTNTGDCDINILNIALSGSSAFTHNGTNTMLPRNKNMTINVTFAPAAAEFASATLTVVSDADTPTAEISITGTSPSGSSGGGDGGCIIATTMESNPPRGYAKASGLLLIVLVCAGWCFWRKERMPEKKPIL